MLARRRNVLRGLSKRNQIVIGAGALVVFSLFARLGAAGQAEGPESITIQKALGERHVHVDKRLRDTLDQAGALWRRDVGGTPRLGSFFKWALVSSGNVRVSLLPLRPALTVAAARVGWLGSNRDPSAALAISIADRRLRLIPNEELAIVVLSKEFMRRSDLRKLFSTDNFVDARALLRWAAGPGTPTGSDPSYRELHRFQSAYGRLAG